MVGTVASFLQIKQSPRFVELKMHCPHCTHPDSIRYGNSRGVQRNRCQACRRIFQTLRRGKDLALKQKAYQLYLEGMRMQAIGNVFSIHHKTVSRWLVQEAQSLPAIPPQTEVCSFIEINELCKFIAKKTQCWLWLAVDSIFGKVLDFVYYSSINTTTLKLQCLIFTSSDTTKCVFLNHIMIFKFLYTRHPIHTYRCT